MTKVYDIQTIDKVIELCRHTMKIFIASGNDQGLMEMDSLIRKLDGMLDDADHAYGEMSEEQTTPTENFHHGIMTALGLRSK